MAGKYHFSTAYIWYPSICSSSCTISNLYGTPSHSEPVSAGIVVGGTAAATGTGSEAEPERERISLFVGVGLRRGERGVVVVVWGRGSTEEGSWMWGGRTVGMRRRRREVGLRALC